MVGQSPSSISITPIPASIPLTTIRRRPVPAASRQLPTSRWHKIKHHARRWVRNWWAWELISAMLSVVAMVVLIVVLTTQDGQTQRSWAIGKTQLTLNTMIAAIGTVMRASLGLAVAGALNQSAWNWFAAKRHGARFEQGKPLDDLETFSEAAADSWNCLKLLWRTRCRYIVSIGALVMVLSLAFDVFIQQVLTVDTAYRDMTLPLSNLSVKSTLPAAQSYATDYTEGYNDDTGILLWRSIVMNGILNTSNALPEANCPGLECTWPITPTIGLCSECATVEANVSTTSNSTCNATTVYTLPALGDGSNPHKEDSVLQMSTCDDGPHANWRMDIQRLDNPTNFVGEINPGFQNGVRNTTIAQVYSFGYSPNSTNSGATTPFFAYKCSFFVCVRGYSATYTASGTTQGSATAFGDKSHWEPDPSGTEWWVFDDIPTELNTEFVPTTNRNSSNSFKVTENFRATLGTLFQNFLVGSEVNINDQLQPGSGAASTVLWKASSSLTGLNATFQSIADTWTSYIRSTSTTSSNTSQTHAIVGPHYAPTVKETILLVGVRWPWLAYPITLQICGLAFLFVTMYTTSQRNVRPWKGHRVPLLLAHLDDSVRTQAQGGLAYRTGLEDRVGAIHVRLDFDGNDGIVFRRVHGVPVSV